MFSMYLVGGIEGFMRAVDEALGVADEAKTCPLCGGVLEKEDHGSD